MDSTISSKRKEASPVGFPFATLFYFFLCVCVCVSSVVVVFLIIDIIGSHARRAQNDLRKE